MAIAQQDIALDEHLLAATFAGMPVAVLVTDRNGFVKLANPLACRILGLESARILGLQIDALLGICGAEEGNAMALPIAQVVQLGLCLSRQNMMLAGAGANAGMLLDISLAPLRNHEGDTLGVMLTLRQVQKHDAQDRAGKRSGAAEVAIAETKPQAIYVRTSGRYVRVFLKDLLWVEAMENYVQLQTIQEKFVVHATLKSMLDALGAKGYQRIHRSFIVRAEEIERIEENQVVVHGTTLPIGKSYRAELLDSLTLI